jgi:NAD(P)-dependent dehydrogenase (short-subunit alcohol dehydrogenase family)
VAWELARRGFEVVAGMRDPVMPFFAAYRASKAAVSAFGESLRTELAGFGIRIVEILPGAIETDMLAASSLPAEGADRPGYETLGDRVTASREQAAGLTTSPERAATAIADAILDDRSPLRIECDPMGAALLASWRSQSDEESMRPMLALFGADD